MTSPRPFAALVFAGLCAASSASEVDPHHPAEAPAVAAESHTAPEPRAAPAPGGAHAVPSPSLPAPSGHLVPPSKGAPEGTPDEIAKSLIVLAQRSFARGDRDSAETAFIEALNSPVSDTLTQEALLAYADFLHQTGRDTRAAAVYEKFLTTYPSAPNTQQVYISLGRTLRDMGAFSLAQTRFYAVLNSSLAVSPENIQRYREIAQLAKFEIAETFYQQGDFAAAGKYFGRIKLLDLPAEDRARASFREAYAFYQDGKLEQAAGTLRAFLEAYPQHLSAQEGRYLLCMALRRLGHTQEALTETLALLRAAQAGAEADRERWTYWQRRTGNQLANDFYEQGDFTAALTIYQTLAELRSDPGWRWPALYQIGLCYERLRQAERAAAAYRDILAESAAAEKVGTSTSAPDAEVRRMAEWRLGQINWVGAIETSMRDYAAQQMPTKAAPPALQ